MDCTTCIYCCAAADQRLCFQIRFLIAWLILTWKSVIKVQKINISSSNNLGPGITKVK